MSQMLYAVITGDIKNSTRLSSDELIRLPGVLKGIFSELNLFLEKKEQWLKYSIFRGDSFQLVTSPPVALEVVLFVRAGLRSAYPKAIAASVDCRLAIALGTVGHLSDNITESSGEAFNLSGLLLERMGKSVFMAAETQLPELNAELNTELALCNELVVRWTYSQATLIPKLLNAETQTVIAGEAGISQAAVAKKLQIMGWLAVEQLLLRYRILCNQNFPGL
ncbi:MAG: hypothetical protein FD166_664 [Bacteroidetes bacterium]|nr:MAG: hypothetical protein FD166_664 [Bacteroidota bacterium]